jgi:oxygen-independent coproporphyrinogen-3 oxidase
MYNEYIMTGLRTMWGVNEQKIQTFGTLYFTYFISMIQDDIMKGHVLQKNEDFTLSKEGKHFADRIAMNLFYVD